MDADLQALLAGIEGFEWDDGNIHKNLIRHLVTQQEAEEAFLVSPGTPFRDERHSRDEERWLMYGQSAAGRRLTVAFTIRATRLRVISVRDMSREERRRYDEAR